MSSENKPIDQPVGQQTLKTLLTLDERLRAGREPDSSLPDAADASDPVLRAGLEALLELEAAIPRTSHSMPSWAPRRIGRFELRSVLGAGGFAVVYLAHDPQLNRQVALKVPRPHALIQPELRQRFVNEARAVAKLDHPAIVQVFEAGSDEDLPYIACALCEGPTLEEWLASQNGLMNSRLAAEIMVHLADGLHYSHEHGILHRDIKPGNVLLFPAAYTSRADFPYHARISDFGLAKLLEDPELDSVTSQLIGTPRFMAPELLGSAARTSGTQFKTVTGSRTLSQTMAFSAPAKTSRGFETTSSVAADVYSLGAVLYAMLTGQAPFGSASLAETMRSIAIEDPVAPELINRSVGKDLSLICLKCLEKNPSERYRSAADLRDDLQRFLSGQCVVARQTPVTVRIRKWCRRHPLRASLLAVSTMFLLSIAVMTYRYAVSMRSLQNRLQDTNVQLRERVRELDKAITIATKSQAEATDERRLTKKLLQIADVNLAGRMWHQGDTRGAQTLLEPWISAAITAPGASPDSASSSFRLSSARLSSADVALRYLWRRITVPSRILKRSTQAIWWIHPDAVTGQLLLAGSEGKIEAVDLRSQASGRDEANELLNVSAGELSCITLSDDRTLAATAGDDGYVRIWKADPADGISLTRLTRVSETPVLPESSVYGVLFLPGTHQWICCARTPKLMIWDGDTGQQVREVVTGHPRFIESMVLSPDRSMLATAGADGMVEVFRLPELTSMLQIPASEKPLAMAAFSSDGRRLACGGWDKMLRLYDLESGNQIGNYLSMAGIYCVASNPQNEILVGDRDGSMTLFRIPRDPQVPQPGEPVLSLKPEKRWAGHEAPVSSICWIVGSGNSSDTGAWVSADRKGVVKVWDAGGPVSTVERFPFADQNEHPGENPVILSAAPYCLRGTQQGVEVFRGPLTGQRHVWLPDKPEAPASEHGAVQLDACHECLATGAKVNSLARFGSPIQFAAGDAEGTVYWIEPTSDGLKMTDLTSVSAGVPIVRLFASSNGRTLCAIDSEWRLSVLDAVSKATRAVFEGSPIAVALDDGESLIRSVSGRDELEVLRISDGQVLATLRGHQSTVSSLLLTPDGQTCVSTSHDRTVCLWDCSTWTLRQQLTGHASPVAAVAISPCSDIMATADEAGVIRLWDLASGRELTELDEHVSGLLNLEFSSDGSSLTGCDVRQKIHRISL